MRIKKTVTEKMVLANRKNAKRSTGPRTLRGKRAAKFNATKWGIFSEGVAIPQCDGESAREKYDALVKELRKEWQPKSLYENWLVEELAKTQWRFRRAAVAEHGSARAGGLDLHFSGDRKICDLRYMRSGLYQFMGVVQDSLQEIRQTGNLSAAAYRNLIPVLPAKPENVDMAAHCEELARRDVEQNLVPWLQEKAWSLASAAASVSQADDERCHDLVAKAALPPAEDLDKILRYERHLQKRMDWILGELRTCQPRRRARFRK
jgi:hypothetical protein